MGFAQNLIQEKTRYSKNPLNIRFVKSALKENSEGEKELRKNVKWVIEVIVGSLKDRVDIEKELATKKQRVQ
ncbi:19249_t:CDS:2, partial [Funneliformis geosporum]